MNMGYKPLKGKKRLVNGNKNALILQKTPSNGLFWIMPTGCPDKKNGPETNINTSLKKNVNKMRYCYRCSNPIVKKNELLIMI